MKIISIFRLDGQGEIPFTHYSETLKTVRELAFRPSLISLAPYDYIAGKGLFFQECLAEYAKYEIYQITGSVPFDMSDAEFVVYQITEAGSTKIGSVKFERSCLPKITIELDDADSKNFWVRYLPISDPLTVLINEAEESLERKMEEAFNQSLPQA